MSNVSNTQEKPSVLEVLTQAFSDSGLTFLDNAATLEQFKQQTEIHFDAETGAVTAFVDGVRQPLSKALSQFGLNNPSLIDGRSLIRARSKSELTTFGEKNRFIQQHGLPAWEALPLSFTEPAAVETWTQWRGLTVAQKSAAIKADPHVQSRLKHDVTHGKTFINHEALAKQKKIRGGSK